MSRGVFIESVRELCDRWRYFQTIGENDLLSLEADIFGPLDESREISFGLDILAFRVLLSNAHKLIGKDGKVGYRLRNSWDEPRTMGSSGVWRVC